jgi:hypothetical protein
MFFTQGDLARLEISMLSEGFDEYVDVCMDMMK